MPKQRNPSKVAVRHTISTAVVTLPMVQVSHSLRFAALPSLHVQHTRAWQLENQVYSLQAAAQDK